MKQAVAAHVPQAPVSGSADADLLSQGKHQLLALGAGQLLAVNLLLTMEIYTINEHLRTGRSLAGATTGAAADYEGVGYKQQIVDDADNTFSSIGADLTLDSPVHLFRKIDLPVTPTSNDPDIAGIRAYLQHGTTPPKVYTDQGYLFAVSDPTLALAHSSSNYGSSHIPKTPVLLDLEVHRALWVPDYKHRDKELFEHCYPSRYLRESTGQAIIPRDSKWELLAIQATSPHSSVPLVKMRQL